MNALQAFSMLRKLGVPVLTTADASAVWREAVPAASKTLARLAEAGLVTSLHRGLWAIDQDLDPLVLPEHLTRSASYVSLQTALYRRGVIEQIPAEIYAVTLGRPGRVTTTRGTFSIHRIAPELFGGFDVLPTGAKLATAEKALVDFVYLSGNRDRMFAALPEIELPRSFDVGAARAWLARIPSSRLKTLATRRFEAWVMPYAPKRTRRQVR